MRITIDYAIGKCHWDALRKDRWSYDDIWYEIGILFWSDNNHLNISRNKTILWKSHQQPENEMMGA